MNTIVTITKNKSHATRHDWLVRGIGKRAIHVAMEENYGLTLSGPKFYCLVYAIAKEANKLGWKHIWLSVSIWSETVTVCNSHNKAIYDYEKRKTIVFGYRQAIVEKNFDDFSKCITGQGGRYDSSKDRQLENRPS